MLGECPRPVQGERPDRRLRGKGTSGGRAAGVGPGGGNAQPYGADTPRRQAAAGPGRSAHPAAPAQAALGPHPAGRSAALTRRDGRCARRARPPRPARCRRSRSRWCSGRGWAWRGSGPGRAGRGPATRAAARRSAIQIRPRARRFRLVPEVTSRGERRLRAPARGPRQGAEPEGACPAGGGGAALPGPSARPPRSCTLKPNDGGQAAGLLPGGPDCAGGDAALPGGGRAACCRAPQRDRAGGARAVSVCPRQGLYLPEIQRGSAGPRRHAAAREGGREAGARGPRGGAFGILQTRRVGGRVAAPGRGGSRAPLPPATTPWDGAGGPAAPPAGPPLRPARPRTCMRVPGGPTQRPPALRGLRAGGAALYLWASPGEAGGGGQTEKAGGDTDRQSHRGGRGGRAPCRALPRGRLSVGARRKGGAGRGWGGPCRGLCTEGGHRGRHRSASLLAGGLSGGGGSGGGGSPIPITCGGGWRAGGRGLRSGRGCAGGRRGRSIRGGSGGGGACRGGGGSGCGGRGCLRLLRRPQAFHECSHSNGFLQGERWGAVGCRHSPTPRSLTSALGPPLGMPAGGWRGHGGWRITPRLTPCDGAMGSAERGN